MVSPFAAAPPVASPVPETYGSVYTSSFAGTAMVFNPGIVTSYGFHFNGFTNGAEFAVTLAAIVSLNNSLDQSGVAHSVVVGYTYYSDATHKMVPSVTTLTVADPTSGPLSGDETAMLEVTDFTTGAVLFASGPLPLTAGWLAIYV